MRSRYSRLDVHKFVSDFCEAESYQNRVELETWMIRQRLNRPDKVKALVTREAVAEARMDRDMADKFLQYIKENVS